jgi:hypothetical protein
MARPGERDARKAERPFRFPAEPRSAARSGASPCLRLGRAPPLHRTVATIMQFALGKPLRVEHAPGDEPRLTGEADVAYGLAISGP